MTFFLFFLLICFFSGMILSKLRMRQMIWLLMGFNVFIMIGYFFFNRI